MAFTCVATQVGGSLTNVLVYDALGKLVAEYGGASAANGTQYLFSDQQGSPRAALKSSGAASELVQSRHDYLPFGEELGAVGMRSSTPGYGAGDGVRQKYAGMETDDTTGMAHTLWRQYDSLSGRWTAPDPYGGSMEIASPQSFNRYTYVNNDPINKVDPTGLMLSDIGVYQTQDAEEARTLQGKSDADWKKSINASYAREHGGTVSYDKDGHATFSSGLQNRTRAWLARGINAAIDRANVTVFGEVAGLAASIKVGEEAGTEPSTKPKAIPSPPQRLTFTTVTGGPSAPVWTIKWKLAKPSAKGGWIVQEVAITDKAGNPRYYYWEAWRVPAKSMFTEFHTTSSFDDMFLGPSGTTIDANAAFYEGLTLPASFIPNNPSTAAGILRSTTTNPNLSTTHATPFLFRNTWVRP